MLKRKTAVASVVLSAALVLAACGAPEEEDPLAPLTNGSQVSNNSSADDDKIYMDGEEIEIAEDQLSAEEADELLDNRNDEEVSDTEKSAIEQQENDYEDLEGSEANSNNKNLGIDHEPSYFGVNLSSIDIAAPVVESFPDDDVNRIAPAALEALDWSDMNFGAKREEITEERANSRAAYMSGYMSEKGESRFREAMLSEADEFFAWILMPSYDREMIVGDQYYEVNPNGIWQVGIGNVSVIEGMYTDTSQPTGGATVQMDRTVYVPLMSGEMLAIDHRLYLSMVPGDSAAKNDWVIDEWQAFIESAEVVRGRPVS